MFQDFKNSLFSPKYIFKNITNSSFKVFMYFLTMLTLILLPAIIVITTNQDLMYPTASEIAANINLSVKDKDIAIIDGKLINPNNHKISFETNGFIYMINQLEINIPSPVISFEAESVAVYYSISTDILYEINRVSYIEINYGNYDFSNQNENYMFSATLLKEVIKNEQIIIINFLTLVFSYAIEYVLIALILAFLMMFSFRLPLKYSVHFKISIYLLTVYAVLNLLFNLLGLSSLYNLTVLAAYIYHIIAFRSIRFKRVGELK